MGMSAREVLGIQRVSRVEGPMLLLVKGTKSFIKEKKEGALLQSFTVKIGLESLRPCM